MKAFQRGLFEGPCVLAIDPGSTRSSVVLWSTERVLPIAGDWIDNRDMAALVRRHSPSLLDSHVMRTDPGVEDVNAEGPASALAIEDVQNFGREVGRPVFQTCKAIGIFSDRFGENFPDRVFELQQHVIRQTLCADGSADASKIWRAVVDRFGGRDVAIGGKLCQHCKGKGFTGRGVACSADAIGTRIINARDEFFYAENDRAKIFEGGLRWRMKDLCLSCQGRGWEIKPGPLYLLNQSPADARPHLRSALAVAACHHERTVGPIVLGGIDAI